MKKTWFLFLFFHLAFHTLKAEANLDSLYRELDRAIQDSKRYVALRETRIGELKRKLDNERREDLVYRHQQDLYHEYKAYIYDSAMHYLDKNIELSVRNGNQRQYNESRIQLSYLLASGGMYTEAIDLLRNIDRHALDADLLARYFLSYDHAYGEMAVYTQHRQSAETYLRLASSFKDSLYALLPKDTETYYNLRENQVREKGDFAEAKRINDIRLARTPADTPEYSIITYFRALNYRGMGNGNEMKYWLGVSALSDIRAAVKDHASLWMLADILRQEGDIERAHRYIRFSWEETKMFNARLRNWQSSEILSMVDKNYQLMNERTNKQLRLYLILISALVVLLIATVVYVYSQMRIISEARNKLDKINRKLQRLNEELATANRIKEVYIGRFMAQCSIYVNKLDLFRRMVNKKIQNNQIPELLKITKREDFQEEELKELYTNFDRAFLQLFPNFIADFNALLKEEERIVLKEEEGLNTELRIFALIRLGIDDSSKIAEFLHYSPNTIYNYRARVKNKARVTREEFEECVRTIS